MKTRIERLMVAMFAFVLVFILSPSAGAQSFKKVKVSGKAPIVQVASGGVSVWALATNGHPYIFKGKSFALANSISLSQIAAGGGNAAQADEVWGLNSSGSIYRASKSGTSWAFQEVAGSGFFTHIAAGPGYHDVCHPYEVWGLNSGSQIYRYNFCFNEFDTISGFLCDLAVGGGNVWGNLCDGTLYHFDFNTLTFSRFYIDPYRAAKVTVGPNGVWVLTQANKYGGGIYLLQYNASTQQFLLIGQGTDISFADIQAGGDGVWGLTTAQPPEIIRLDSESLFHQVPGSLVSLSVGSGGGVWGIDAANQVFAFSMP